MKKILMIVVVMMAALSSYAQEMYLGGGISLWRDCDADEPHSLSHPILAII